MGNLLLSSGSIFANRFEIDKTAGSGGMGTVYRARDRYSGDVVALKLLHAGESGPDESQRFAREAQLLSELRHPGIVSHIAHGQTPDGQRFLAMEWLDGLDLGQRLSRGPLPLRDCLVLLAHVADALSLSHQRGIIHRDLKPTNLFLCDGDVLRVKILDFGIARRMTTSHAMTRTGMVIGTPEYMAPEQARGGRELTPAVDLFSLGCVLYECLTGQPPFVADHIAAVLVRILFEEPTPIEERRPGLPAALVALLSRLLAKDPGQRLGDAAVLQTELLALGELPEPALAVTAASPKPRTESFADREQSLFSIVLAASSEDEIGRGATQPESALQFAGLDRQALIQALMALGAAPDFLANGMLVVTAPPMGSAQDQATLAARAALLVKDRWPAAGVVLATGRGVVRGRTAVGEVVELAARSLKTESLPSSSKAISGVFVDSLSAKLLEGRFAQTPHPGGAMLLYEERDADSSRPLLGKPTPCVGREPELATMEAYLTGCIEDSEARVLLVTAAPGVGKSRLRHEFMRRIEKRSEPITRLLGRGDLMSTGAPYGIVCDAIQRLCGINRSESLDSQRERLRTRIGQHVSPADHDQVVLFIGELCHVPFPDAGKPMLQAARREPKLMRDCLRRALLHFLAAECRAAPVLLVLDDLQWGDELTVTVLNEALREQVGTALFVLAFARPEVHETFPSLWQGHKVQEIPLKGLSKKACERLIQQVLGKHVSPEAADRLVEQSAGNALFLEELIRSMAEGTLAEQPETVLAMLQSRIGRLDAGARRAVRAASIYGQTFWHGGIAAVLGLSSSDSDLDVWLAALTKAEFIQAHGTSRLMNEKEYGFRHALVRDATYSLLLENDLAAGHRRAAEFLEAAGEQDAAIIAEHFERSGDNSRAASCYLRAVEEGLVRGNYLGALRHIERGRRCEPTATLLGQFHSAESFLAFVLDRLDQMGDAANAALQNLQPGSLAWCRAMIPAIFAALNRQEKARGFELTTRLLAAEPEAGARAAYLEALFTVQSLFAVAAPASLLHAIYDRVATYVAAEESANPTIRRYFHSCRLAMKAFREPGPWTLVQDGQLATTLHDQAGDRKLSRLMRCAGTEWGWLDLGDLVAARQRLSALQATFEQSQDVTHGALWRHLFARSLCTSEDEGDWMQAERIVAPLLDFSGGMVLFRLLAQGVMARLSLLRGRLADAEAHARAVMQLFPILPIWAAHSAPIQILALLGMGQAIAATAVAELVLGVIPRLGGIGVAEVEFRLAASVAFHAAGDLKRAHLEMRETLRQIQLRADDITDPFWRNSYLSRNPYCARAQRLAKDWDIAIVVS